MGKPRKRAQLEISLAVKIVLAVAVLILIYIGLIRPNLPLFATFGEGLREMICSNDMVSGWWDSCNKYSYIRTFELDRGVDGTLWLTYRFVNDPTVDAKEDDKPAYTWYNITASDLTDLGTSLASRYVNEKELKSGQVSTEELAAGKVFTFQIKIATDSEKSKDVQAALVPKIYRLNALDENGKALETQVRDYRGVFPANFLKPAERHKYDADVESFVSLAEDLKTRSTTFSTDSYTKTLIMNGDLTLIGFSKDFYGGNTINRNQYVGSLVCTKGDIQAPKECADQSTCVCFCTKADKCGAGCNDRDINDCPGRICYAYPTYGFVGGALGACMISSLWIPGSVWNGQNDYPIPSYKGSGIKDTDDAFNSLSMVNDDNTPVNLNIDSKSLTVEIKDTGEKIPVNSLVITK